MSRQLYSTDDVIAVTGLAREAKVIARPGVVAIAGGGDGPALEERVIQALAKGANRLISVGLCGALASGLRAGDCLVATEVVAGERFAADAAWTKALLAATPGARPALIAGSDAVVASREEKSALRRATGADAVDMESHRVARLAGERGLPFAVLRVVSDTAQQSLPPAARVAMRRDGRIDVPAVLRSLAGKPGQIPALIRTAWEAEKAFRILGRCRDRLGGAVEQLKA